MLLVLLYKYKFTVASLEACVFAKFIDFISPALSPADKILRGPAVVPELAVIFCLGLKAIFYYFNIPSANTIYSNVIVSAVLGATVILTSAK
jgi:hypothetical protein